MLYGGKTHTAHKAIELGTRGMRGSKPAGFSGVRERAALTEVCARPRGAPRGAAMDTHGVAPPPGQVDPSRLWDAGGGAAMGAPSSPALAFAFGVGLMLSVPLLLALTIAGCWWRCQQRNTRRWSREDSFHMPSARWSECREDPSDDDYDDDDDDDSGELVGARREEEPITPRRQLLASSDEEGATPRRQRASRPGRISRRGTGGRSTSAAPEPELTKVFFRSSDWSSHSQPKMAELSLQGVASVQELCARLRAALGRGALAEGLALSIEYEDCMGEMSQLTHGAEVDVLVGARSLYVTTKRAKSLPPEPASSKASSTSQCSSLQPLVAADGDDDLSGCSGVKSTCGGIEVASSAIPRKRSRPERHRSRLTKLKHYFTL